MVKLLLQIMAGMVVYGLLAWIFKMESFAYLVQTIKGRRTGGRADGTFSQHLLYHIQS